jgi:two-component system OmpR family sensor kinase
VNSIRWRLTASYSLVLALTIVAFGASLYVERRSVAVRERRELLSRRLENEAVLIRGAIEEWGRFLPVVIEDSALGRPGAISFRLADGLRAQLDGLPRDMIFVMDPGGRLIFTSRTGTELDLPALQLVYRTLLQRPLTQSGQLRLDADGESHRYVIDTVTGGARRQLRSLMIVGQPTEPLSGPPQLLISMLLVTPLVLIGSSALGYWLAGRALRPLDVMVEEVEAIQDGRSLHRRLAVPTGSGELARLGANLNAMLGRVERSFVALRRFTADASHELKTPLMVLRAGVEGSLTHPETPSEIVNSLDETLRQINEMTELVTNLLTLARSDEGRSSLVVTEDDLVALVAEAGETAEILGAQQAIGVELVLPAEPLMASIESGRIRQLLMNLVTNAIKYTSEGGEVSIQLEGEGDNAVIRVRDNGIGIAPGDLPFVFERFWRADPARSRTGERTGTGLGLAIAKWVVDAHGGSISVDSRPGRGSTFTVKLPLHATEEVPVPLA